MQHEGDTNDDYSVSQFLMVDEFEYWLFPRPSSVQNDNMSGNDRLIRVRMTSFPWSFEQEKHMINLAIKYLLQTNESHFMAQLSDAHHQDLVH